MPACPPGPVEPDSRPGLVSSSGCRGPCNEPRSRGHLAPTLGNQVGVNPTQSLSLRPGAGLGKRGRQEDSLTLVRRKHSCGLGGRTLGNTHAATIKGHFESGHLVPSLISGSPSVEWGERGRWSKSLLVLVLAYGLDRPSLGTDSPPIPSRPGAYHLPLCNCRQVTDHF